MQDTSVSGFMGSSSRRWRGSRYRRTKKHLDEPERLEASLKKLLKSHYGSTKHKEVLKEIDNLIPHNPVKDQDPTASSHWEGDFVCHTIPEFPGRLKNEDKSVIQYTLGRLSFGVFQPHNLVCTIRSVRQSIGVRMQTETGAFRSYEYPVLMDLTIHTVDGQELPAVVSHDAICFKCPKNQQRLKVIFKGSTLVPSQEVLNDTALFQTWQTTFAGAYAKADKERGIISKTFRGMMAWWFQMTFPDDQQMEQSRNHSVHFEMKRSPKGWLDVLYLSDNTRVTQGNRGTIVVVEPVASANEGGMAESMADNTGMTRDSTMG